MYIEMVEKALEKEPQLKTCDYEFRLPKPSYTWHTLQAISQEFTDIEFTLLIGGDNWAAFDKWYHHEGTRSARLRRAAATRFAVQPGSR